MPRFFLMSISMVVVLNSGLIELTTGHVFASGRRAQGLYGGALHMLSGTHLRVLQLLILQPPCTIDALLGCCRILILSAKQNTGYLMKSYDWLTPLPFSIQNNLLDNNHTGFISLYSTSCCVRSWNSEVRVYHGEITRSSSSPTPLLQEK